MSRLLIANDCCEQVFGHDAVFNKAIALWSLRLLWQVENNDIVVLPIAPHKGHLEYISELKGIQYNSLQVIIAPPGSADYLSADRLVNTELCRAIKEALTGRTLESILPLTPDTAVVKLARLLDIESIVPGTAFASQSGGILANSKAVFRAIAAGAEVPIPIGFVVNKPQDAEEILTNMLLEKKISVIVKKEFGQGCRGNEVLSHIHGVVPNGGRRGLVLLNRTAINTYIVDNWDWLTNSSCHSIVMERYFPDSLAIFAEFNLTDQGIEFAGLGEMIAAPIADGQVIPPVGLSPVTIGAIIDGGYRLSAAMHKIGYRGVLSADAIITSDNTVLFSEYNGRITGSTHIYSIVGDRIVGKDWMQNRVLLERRGWTALSFQDAVNMLYDSGLAFNYKTRIGVVLTGTFLPTRKVISYTVVAENMAAVLRIEKQLHEVSPRAIEALA